MFKWRTNYGPLILKNSSNDASYESRVEQFQTFVQEFRKKNILTNFYLSMNSTL